MPIRAALTPACFAKRRLFDKDENGTLSLGELTAAMESSGVDTAEVETMMKEVDADNNHTLDVDEFVELLRANWTGRESDVADLSAFSPVAVAAG